MSPLGLLLTATLRDETFADDPCLLYTTTYTETQALEKFIDSFPFPSPLLFQTSIHPGGAEQAMIYRRQPVTEFFPLAGSARLLGQAIVLACTTPRPRTVWIGGEERGGWLRGVNEASEATFAWALSLTADPAGALARVSWEPGVEATTPRRLSTANFQEMLENRRPAEWGETGLGRFRWEWQ